MRAIDEADLLLMETEKLRECVRDFSRAYFEEEKKAGGLSNTLTFTKAELKDARAESDAWEEAHRVALEDFNRLQENEDSVNNSMDVIKENLWKSKNYETTIAGKDETIATLLKALKIFKKYKSD
jgi:Sec-independent protein translocase protein TatA